MRKRWTCSRCGSQFSATWRPCLKISIPVVCNTCNGKQKETNGGVVMNSNLLNRTSTNEGRARVENLGSSSNSTQISPSSSQNVPFSVGMIFGNLTFAPTLAIPLTIPGKSQEMKKVKSEAVTADDHQIHSTKSSALKDDYHTAFQIIKQEFESYENEIFRNKKKKKRMNQPQETVSPLSRFIKKLLYMPPCRYHPARRRNKYDDVLIYERSTLSISENEIGLGAQKLAPPPLPPPPEVSSKIKTMVLWWQ